MIIVYILLPFLLNCHLSPVLILPGDGSNSLEAKLTGKKNLRHFYCSSNSDWYKLWLDIKYLIPGAIDCWSDNIKLVYD